MGRYLLSHRKAQAMHELASKLSDTGHAAQERLAAMLEHVVDEGEQLLDTAQRSGSEHFGAARERFEHQLGRARAELEAFGDTAGYKARRAARLTGHAVHEHPVAALGIAAGIGALLAAVLMKRR